MGNVLLTLGLLVLALGLAACETAAMRLERDLARAETPLEKGQVLYEASCQRCHSLYMPRSYATAEWRFFVRKYGRRARLTDDQQQLVFTYLAANARDR